MDGRQVTFLLFSRDISPFDAFPSKAEASIEPLPGFPKDVLFSGGGREAETYASEDAARFIALRKLRAGRE